MDVNVEEFQKIFNDSLEKYKSVKGSPNQIHSLVIEPTYVRSFCFPHTTEGPSCSFECISDCLESRDYHYTVHISCSDTSMTNTKSVANAIFDILWYFLPKKGYIITSRSTYGITLSKRMEVR